jgi:hypothetical protein
LKGWAIVESAVLSAHPVVAGENARRGLNCGNLSQKSPA